LVFPILSSAGFAGLEKLYELYGESGDLRSEVAQIKLARRFTSEENRKRGRQK